jgi:hypothetical protein
MGAESRAELAGHENPTETKGPACEIRAFGHPLQAGTPPLVRVHWPLRPTTAAATDHPAVAAAIVRMIAESATALARHKAGSSR